LIYVINIVGKWLINTQANFHIWQHTSAKRVLRTDHAGYKLPLTVADHIDLIGPTFHFPHIKQKVRTATKHQGFATETATAKGHREVLHDEAYKLYTESGLVGPKVVDKLYNIPATAVGKLLQKKNGSAKNSSFSFNNKQAIFAMGGYVDPVDVDIYMKTFRPEAEGLHETYPSGKNLCFEQSCSSEGVCMVWCV
jgi:hypothetical protein